MNLRLLQLGDSALPVGGYMHSWGLEVAHALRLVHDPATLETWTRAWLWHCLGPLEGVVVAATCRAVLAGMDDVAADLQVCLACRADQEVCRHANRLLDASLNPPTIRLASLQMGGQLLSLGATWAWSAAGVARLEGGDWHHAAAFGVLAALAGASAREALVVYLHQAALGMIGAGVRAAGVGHTHGQQVLAYLHNDLAELADELAERDLDTAGSNCPFYEVLCDEQTRLFTRLFRS